MATNGHGSKAKEFDQQLNELAELSYSKKFRAGLPRNRSWKGGRSQLNIFIALKASTSLSSLTEWTSHEGTIAENQQDGNKVDLTLRCSPLVAFLAVNDQIHQRERHFVDFFLVVFHDIPPNNTFVIH